MRYSYESLMRRADKVSAMIVTRQRKLSAAAGLNPMLLGIHPHNAMVSFQSGQPWRNVDYSLVRQILWLQREKEFKAHSLVNSLYRRGRTAFAHEVEAN